MSAQVLTRRSHTPRVIINRYAGTCNSCNSRVEAGEGHATSTPRGWVVSHATSYDCVVIEETPSAPVGAPVAPEETPAPSSAPQAVQGTFDIVEEALITADNGQVYSGIAPGTYTMTNEAHPYTFRVRVQPTDSTFAPGSTIISFLAGPDNDSDYVNFGFLRGEFLTPWRKFHAAGYAPMIKSAQRFLANVEAATPSRECIRCGRTLTTVESLARGIGPTCADKGW